MSLAVITDSSVNLPTEIQGHADVYILDIPVIVEEQPFVEGKNLDVNQFYEKMANSEEPVSYTHLTLPTTPYV